MLVTPNNPTGCGYPPSLLAQFMDLAVAHGIALVIDETYKDFRSACGAPHALFANLDAALMPSLVQRLLECQDAGPKV